MKSHIAMLSVCLLSLAACGHADTPTPTPTPIPQPTCQRPRGWYTLKGALAQTGTGQFCPAPAVDQTATVGFEVNAAGNIVSIYNMPCTTTYSTDGCAMRTSCSIAYFNGTRAEVYDFSVSVDGRMLRGYYEVTGTGAQCPHARIEGVAAVEAL